MFRQIFIFSIQLFIFSNLFGQATGAPSPFDLTHRLPKELLATTATGENVFKNPFDVRPHLAPGAEKNSLVKKTEGKSFIKSIGLPKGQSSSKTFLFWALVVTLFFLAFSISVNRSAVVKAWRGFLNNSSLTMAHRESLTQSGAIPYLLLYINFLLNAGVFLFLILRSFKGENFNNPAMLAVCVFAIGLIFSFKHLLLRLVGWLFPVAAEVNRYNFTIVVFNCVLGFFLMPFNFLIAFSGDFQSFLIFWTIGLVAIFYGYRILRSILIGSKFLVGSQFHFLLYLCAAEIAPVLILFKMAMQ